MRFIVVDSADSRGFVAIFDERRLVALEVHTSEEDYSSWLLPAVRRTLSSERVELSELDAYAVCAGPGSFTGLRVGLTTVKAWAEIYSRPIIALSRLEALATGEGLTRESFTATFLDARRNQVFAALYKHMSDSVGLVGDEAVMPLPEFVARVALEAAGQPVRWITSDTGLLNGLPEWKLLAAKGHVLQKVEPPFAALLSQLAYRKFLRGETTDALSLDANYVRRSDAELLWKGNKSAFNP
jgi:tRNA threonylcarbamoyladenosine biosynthesis protein TsaB